MRKVPCPTTQIKQRGRRWPSRVARNNRFRSEKENYFFFFLAVFFLATFFLAGFLAVFFFTAFFLAAIGGLPKKCDLERSRRDARHPAPDTHHTCDSDAYTPKTSPSTKKSKIIFRRLWRSERRKFDSVIASEHREQSNPCNVKLLLYGLLRRLNAPSQ